MLAWICDYQDIGAKPAEHRLVCRATPAEVSDPEGCPSRRALFQAKLTLYYARSRFSRCSIFGARTKARAQRSSQLGSRRSGDRRNERIGAALHVLNGNDRIDLVERRKRRDQVVEDVILVFPVLPVHQGGCRGFYEHLGWPGASNGST